MAAMERFNAGERENLFLSASLLILGADPLAAQEWLSARRDLNEWTYRLEVAYGGDQPDETPGSRARAETGRLEASRRIVAAKSRIREAEAEQSIAERLGAAGNLLELALVQRIEFG